MPHRNVAVWIDHHEAKIFHVDRTTVETTTVRVPASHVHRHPKVTADHNHPSDATHYFKEVVHALEGAEQILILGPATAKLELIKYVHKHDQALVPKIVGVETVDHPTDNQLVAHVRSYFAKLES
jgi:stalled ribosome rescue protein Dom34